MRPLERSLLFFDESRSGCEPDDGEPLRDEL
jgi:hypothetical protein